MLWRRKNSGHRLSARDRALLEALVVHERRELADLGVEVSLSCIMRKLIRAAPRAPRSTSARAPTSPPRGIRPTRQQLRRRKRRARRARFRKSHVRALLRKKTAERRGLGAGLAGALGVERAQVSRFKAGKETFPAAKLAGLFDLLSPDE